MHRTLQLRGNCGQGRIGRRNDSGEPWRVAPGGSGAGAPLFERRVAGDDHLDQADAVEPGFAASRSGPGGELGRNQAAAGRVVSLLAADAVQRRGQMWASGASV